MVVAAETPQAPLGRREIQALAAAAIVVLALRLLYPSLSPVVSGDEGTWPLGAKLWADSGVLVPNFFTTPLYHLTVGIPFKIFGSTLTVARVVSGLFGVLNLFLTYRLSRRLFGDHRAAIWAALLLGTSYPAVLVDRKAFIEPIQIAWMLGLAICYLDSGRRALIGVSVCTAGLLLTKANAVFLIPALAAATLLEWRRAPLGDGRHLAALAAGVLLAGFGYWVVYALNPVEFVAGWSQKLMIGTHKKTATDVTGSDLINAGANVKLHRPLFAIGRFRVNPFAWDGKIRDLTATEPFLAVGGVIAVVKALWTRRAAVLSLWFVFGMAFYFVQGHLENHVSVLYPILAIGATWLLFDGVRQSWPIAAATVIFLFGLGRTAGNLFTSRETTLAGVRWFADHATASETTIAAPRMLMMFAGKPVSMFELENKNLPTCSMLRAKRADWVVFDDREWMEYIRVAKHDMKAVADSIAGCTTAGYRDRAIQIYRIIPEKAP